MKIVKLKLKNFRNHPDSEIECSPTINLFLGPNGQGKTNILEAIAYLSLGKSFFTAPDGNLIRKGSDEFVIHGSFVSGENVTYSVGIRYTENPRRKEVRINNKDQERIASLIGKFPVVILYPEQHSITNGAPSERRRFMDLVLSQASPKYFETISEYRRILKQRNAILMDTRGRYGSVAGVLESWDEPFVRCAVEITDFRMNFIHDFVRLVKDNYKKIVGTGELPGVTYEQVVPITRDMSSEEKYTAAQSEFEKTKSDELRYGMSIFGPHRDDLILLINDLEVRKYASQGQQKSFLVALKISESQYLMEKRNEQPIILLDDLFGELDNDRASQVLDLTTGMGQTFVTSADDKLTGSSYLMRNGYMKYIVTKGSVSYV
jgi:DNA replication and repair protein RecF